jgi:hypothetical protein
MNELEEIIRRLENQYYYNQVFVEDTCVIGIARSVTTFVFEILGQDPNNDNTDVPVDLSQFTTLYISFFDTNSDPIKIERTLDPEVDLVQGLVRFDILESEANNILSLDTDTFYISTYSVSENDSDETSVFSGKFLESSAFNEYLLQLQKQEVNNFTQSRISFYTTETQKLSNIVVQQDATINALVKEINTTQTNIIRLDEDIKSAVDKLGGTIPTQSIRPDSPLAANPNLQGDSLQSQESLELANANNNQIVTTNGGDDPPPRPNRDPRQR